MFMMLKQKMCANFKLIKIDLKYLFIRTSLARLLNSGEWKNILSDTKDCLYGTRFHFIKED